jgi:hypothetical protein
MNRSRVAIDAAPASWSRDASKWTDRVWRSMGVGQLVARCVQMDRSRN